MEIEFVNNFLLMHRFYELCRCGYCEKWVCVCVCVLGFSEVWMLGRGCSEMRVWVVREWYGFCERVCDCERRGVCDGWVMWM